MRTIFPETLFAIISSKMYENEEISKSIYRIKRIEQSDGSNIIRLPSSNDLSSECVVLYHIINQVTMSKIIVVYIS